MLQDKDGHRLYRRLEVRVIYPEKVLPPEKIVQKAPPGKGISDENINDILMAVATQLEEKFPWWEFEPIQTASSQPRVARFVFSFKGYSMATKTPNAQQRSEPGTGAVDATPTTDTVGDTETRIPAAPELGEEANT